MLRAMVSRSRLKSVLTGLALYTIAAAHGRSEASVRQRIDRIGAGTFDQTWATG